MAAQRIEWCLGEYLSEGCLSVKRGSLFPFHFRPSSFLVCAGFLFTLFALFPLRSGLLEAMLSTAFTVISVFLKHPSSYFSLSCFYLLCHLLCEPGYTTVTIESFAPLKCKEKKKTTVILKG